MTKNQFRKPKVALIHPALGVTEGGSQVFVLELAQELRKYCDITILSGSEVNELCKPVWSLPRRNSRSNVLYNCLCNLIGKFFNSPDIVIEHISSMMPVFIELMKNDYDVIYPNNDWGGLLVAALVRKIKGTPVMFTEHCGLMKNCLIAKRNLKFKPDKYICLSDSTLNWAKQNYNKDKCVLIPNGVSINRFNSSILRVELPEVESPIILTVGRYYPNKRLELAIDAVSMLSKGSLVVLSNGENIDKLVNYGKLKLKNRFILRSVKYDEVIKYYNLCDVFTLPSKEEPFGLVYLEAMACNKPVVAPLDESRRFIVGDAGLLCNVENVQDYSNTLQRAINTNFESKPLTQAKRFSWNKTAAKYFNIINELIN